MFCLANWGPFLLLSFCPLTIYQGGTLNVAPDTTTEDKSTFLRPSRGTSDENYLFLYCTSPIETIKTKSSPL
ncbi:hypothetical protein BDN70DRAFT_874866, partial [Pholiota conissans]